ncbi:MAG: AP endonuc 2 protein [Gammaproteobacteria bacterium]|nr:AP endonuc 2 protein [Gammaproteobacteria bacterium]
MNRRKFLASSAASLALLQMSTHAAFGQAVAGKAGRLRQSVARWCFANVPIDSFCEQLQDMGVTGMDLVGPEEWDICKRYGITPCMVMGAGSFLEPADGSGRRFGRAFGWNKLENHAELLATARTNIGLAAAAGLPAIIGLFGDREGMSDEQGIENCVTGLREIVPLLEQKNVTLAIELLNSKVDHPDYQGDNTAFGVAVCQRVGSKHIKLVYDAYHMQVMEGNLISTIRQNIDYIFHIHIAGVPGRHEIDATQEVNWHAVAMAIADLGFQGYVAHEWIPTGADPMAELRKAVGILIV